MENNLKRRNKIMGNVVNVQIDWSDLKAVEDYEDYVNQLIDGQFN